MQTHKQPASQPLTQSPRDKGAGERERERRADGKRERNAEFNPPLHRSCRCCCWRLPNSSGRYNRETRRLSVSLASSLGIRSAAVDAVIATDKRRAMLLDGGGDDDDNDEGRWTRGAGHCFCVWWRAALSLYRVNRAHLSLSPVALFASEQSLSLSLRHGRRTHGDEHVSSCGCCSRRRRRRETTGKRGKAKGKAKRKQGKRSTKGERRRCLQQPQCFAATPSPLQQQQQQQQQDMPDDATRPRHKVSLSSLFSLFPGEGKEDA